MIVVPYKWTEFCYKGSVRFLKKQDWKHPKKKLLAEFKVCSLLYLDFYDTLR